MASIYRRRKGGNFYITYWVRPGQRQTVRGCKDRAATEALARKLESDAMLRGKGVIDPRMDHYASAEAKPLKSHIADFIASLKARGVTPAQVKAVEFRIKHILELCSADRISRLSASAVQQALGTIREAGATSRSRRKGASLQTCNHYLRAIKQFTRWLWRDGRIHADLCGHLAGYNLALDRRHDRRALSDSELSRLIAAAEAGPLLYHTTGPDRAMLYRVALGTGFRANELHSLTPESFDLQADPSTVTVQAAYSKHRRQDVQPIRRDLADVLRPWLAKKECGCRVFPVTDTTAKMIQHDLNAARNTWIEEAKTDKERAEREKTFFLSYRDGADRVADFHALRHTYISRLVASGANIKVAQELARHSTPTLTLGRYAHVQLIDQTRALDALPAIKATKANVVVLAATGA